MLIFIYQASKGFAKLEVNPSEKVGTIIKQLVPAGASTPDYEQDYELYLLDQENDLDKDKTFEELEVKRGDTFFIGKCKKVSVTVTYAGQQKTIILPSSFSGKNLKRKALKEFKIEGADGVDLLLWLSPEKYIEDKEPIGQFADYSSCSLSLTLATKQDIQGDPSRDVFLQHLDAADYLAGEMEGNWGTHNNEGPEWPFVIFWIKLEDGGKIYLRFNFQDYNRLAPNSIPWDQTTNNVLDSPKWPKYNKRCSQIFRPEWRRDALYLPCDRIAINGHGDWPQKHPYLIWKAGDSFVKYLKEVYQALNPDSYAI